MIRLLRFSPFLIFFHSNFNYIKNGKSIGILHFFLHCFYLSPNIAQQSFIDSLETELTKTQSVEKKLNILKGLTKAISESDLQETMITAKKGKALAQKQKSGEWMAEFDFQIGDLYQMMSKYDSTHLYFDAAIQNFK